VKVCEYMMPEESSFLRRIGGAEYLSGAMAGISGIWVLRFIFS